MLTDNESSDGEDQALDLFIEPDGYYEAEKPPTTVTHRTQDGRELQLRLVGHNPLWGHLLWQAGRTISGYLETHAATLLKNRTILELGAGAGLPSLISALQGARQVVVTDYPDQDLIDNLRHNISANIPGHEDGKRNVVAEGYIWGASTSTLTAHLPDEIIEDQSGTVGLQAKQEKRFDLLILADLLFNHSEHRKLLDTVIRTLKLSADAQALVFFTPYRPWLLEKDLAFFELASESGEFVVEKILETVMEKVMFEEDRGDEMLRRTVFGYSLRWSAERLGEHGSEEAVQ